MRIEALKEVNIGYKKVFDQDCNKDVIDKVVERYQREMTRRPHLWQFYLQGSKAIILFEYQLF